MDVAGLGEPADGLAERDTSFEAADIEFGEYLIINKDLNRHNAFILIALAGYAGDGV